MNINFLNAYNIKYSPVQKIGNKNTASPNFKGLDHDVFEKSPNTKIDWDKKIEELELNLKQKKYLSVKAFGEVSRAYTASANGEITKKEFKEIKAKHTQALNDVKQAQYELDLAIFEKRKEINPNTAFFYNPDLKPQDISTILFEKPEIKSASSLEFDIGGSNGIVNRWVRGGFLDADRYGRLNYIDTSFPKNKAFLEEYKTKTAGKMTVGEVACEYNFLEDEILSLIKEGKIKLIYNSTEEAKKRGASKFSWHVDTDDEATKKIISDHVKITPQQGGKYYKGLCKSAAPVPIGVLAQLGFGSLKQIFSLVQTGHIKGKISDVTKKDGTKAKACYVDINDDYTENILKNLRDKNKNIVETKELAQALGIKKEELNERILNDEVAIISRYLFSDDYNRVFVNLNDPKNKQLTEELQNIEQRKADEKAELQKQAEERKKQLKSETSLRMKITWLFCPKTKESMSKQSEHDPYMASVFEKIENGEELTKEEDIDYKKYCKDCWGKEEKSEYRNALIKGASIMEIYRTLGIDEIDDPKVRDVILAHNANQ